MFVISFFRVISEQNGDNSAPALQVPSAVVPQEHNILINPEHPCFLQLIWSDPKSFQIKPFRSYPSKCAR